MGDADRQRFELLYAAHYERVLAYTLSRASVDVARDAAGDTFLVAWRRLPDIPDDPLPWLIGVARRCMADQRRSRGRRDALAVRLRRVGPEPAGWDDDPADAVVDRDQVVAAMRRLTSLDREVLRLVAWDGLSNAQAAQSLGCSRATFAVRLHRARRRLAGALADEEAVDSDDVVLAAPVSPRPRSLRAVRSGENPARVSIVSVSVPLSAPPEEAS